EPLVLIDPPTIGHVSRIMPTAWDFKTGPDSVAWRGPTKEAPSPPRLGGRPSTEAGFRSVSIGARYIRRFGLQVSQPAPHRVRALGLPSRNRRRSAPRAPRSPRSPRQFLRPP